MRIRFPFVTALYQTRRPSCHVLCATLSIPAALSNGLGQESFHDVATVTPAAGSPPLPTDDERPATSSPTPANLPFRSSCNPRVESTAPHSGVSCVELPLGCRERGAWEKTDPTAFFAVRQVSSRPLTRLTTVSTDPAGSQPGAVAIPNSFEVSQVRMTADRRCGCTAYARLAEFAPRRINRWVRAAATFPRWPQGACGVPARLLDWLSDGASRGAGHSKRAFRLCRRKAIHEERDADQCPPAGGMPHCHR